MKIHTYNGQVSERDRRLPLYTVTVGESTPQERIHRPAGVADYQLLYTVKGCGTVEIGAEEFAAGEGTVFLLPPFTPHEYRPEGEGWCTLWITYNGSAAHASFPFSAGIRECAAFPSFHRRIARMKGADAARRASPVLYELLLTIREAEAQIEAPVAPVGGVGAAVQYASEHYAEQIGLPQLAELAGVSEGHLCRLFKEHTHMRPMEYVTYLRTERAKSLLLEEPATTVGEIAHRTGYSSAAYFIRVFRAHTGMTPEGYRACGGATGEL